MGTNVLRHDTWVLYDPKGKPIGSTRGNLDGLVVTLVDSGYIAAVVGLTTSRTYPLTLAAMPCPKGMSIRIVEKPDGNIDLYSLGMEESL